MNTQVNFKDTDLLSASDNPVWSKQIFLVLLTFNQYHKTHRGALVKSVRSVSQKGYNDLIPLLCSTLKNFYWGIHHLTQRSKCLVWMYFMWLQCMSCLLLLRVFIHNFLALIIELEWKFLSQSIASLVFVPASSILNRHLCVGRGHCPMQ